MPSHLYEFKDAYALVVNLYGDGYYIFEKSIKLQDIASGKFIAYLERDYTSNRFVRKKIDTEITKLFNKIKLHSIYDISREKELKINKQFHKKNHADFFGI